MYRKIYSHANSIRVMMMMMMMTFPLARLAHYTHKVLSILYCGSRRMTLLKISPIFPYFMWRLCCGRYVYVFCAWWEEVRMYIYLFCT